MKIQPIPIVDLGPMIRVSHFVYHFDNSVCIAKQYGHRILWATSPEIRWVLQT
jgi:hypothetical protein